MINTVAPRPHPRKRSKNTYPKYTMSSPMHDYTFPIFLFHQQEPKSTPHISPTSKPSLNLFLLTPYPIPASVLRISLHHPTSSETLDLTPLVSIYPPPPSSSYILFGFPTYQHHHFSSHMSHFTSHSLTHLSPPLQPTTTTIATTHIM